MNKQNSCLSETKNKKEKDFVSSAFSKALRVNEDFFGIKISGIHLNLLSSRKELDILFKKETPRWLVATVGFAKNGVDVLAPWMFEKESIHPKRKFGKILTHEIAHIFLREIYKFSEPRWLVEGIPMFVSGLDKEDKLKLDFFLKNGSFLYVLGNADTWNFLTKHGAYNLSGEWIGFLIKKFGKRKFLGFVSKLNNQKYDFENFNNKFKQFFKKDILKLEKLFLRGGEKK